MAIPSLRGWQEEALRTWETHDFRGIFAVATGGGKTLFALAAREKFLEGQPSVRTVIVVPTTALLDQWYVEVTEIAGVSEEDVKILSSGEICPDKKVNLVVINSARAFSNFDFGDEKFLLIVDECHRAGSLENSRALEIPTAATIGLSATPQRDFDDGLERYVKPKLGELLFRYSLSDAIRDGVLTKLKLEYIKVPLLPFEQERYDQLSKKIAAASANDNQETLEVLLRTRARVYNQAAYRIPVARAVLANHRAVRSLVFLESISAANQLCDELEADGHLVTRYHSELSPKLRRSNLRMFRKGIFDVLVTCRALDEGFNVPEARLALIVAGTSSSRQRTQRVGRVLRIIDEKTVGEVITLYATPVEERRLREEAQLLGIGELTHWKSASVNA